MKPEIIKKVRVRLTTWDQREWKFTIKFGGLTIHDLVIAEDLNEDKASVKRFIFYTQDDRDITFDKELQDQIIGVLKKCIDRGNVDEVDRIVKW